MGRGTIYPFVEKNLFEYISKGMTVIETGCGAAKYRGLLENIGVKYFGTDVPNDYYQDSGDVDIFCSSDCLPFKDNSADIVFNQGSIDYMPSISKTLDEAYRVLKPEGKLLIYTYRYDILLMIHENCRKTKREWELNHHVFTSSQMLKYLRRASFQASDITGNLDVWSPRKWKKTIFQITGLLKYFRKTHTTWRAFEAVKPTSV
ncbi:MAG: class I SAM-dependent methyltransferase [Candidatus Latescibacteria bacterium]|nr:class I SAM-dependent methyltransferase [Candidatus Latescibacterota bacterium]